MGRKWYENGKFLQKKNTSTDLLTVQSIRSRRNTVGKKICASMEEVQGGFLIGAVLQQPDLFKAAVVRVPFVDVLTRMIDPTIPLTTAEWKEWGDPRREEFYFYMKSYSPFDYVKAQNYLAIPVTTG